MNIGIDIRSLSEEHYTGISWYTHHLLQALFALDKKNHYFLFENAWKKRSRASTFSGSNIHTITTRIPNKLLHASLLVLRRPRLDRLIEKRAGVKLDLFFMPNWHYAAFSPSCKTVLTLHDLAAELFPDFFSLKRRLWHAFLRPKHLCRNARHIITVSEHTKNDAMRFYHLPSERATAIPLGVKSPATTVETQNTTREKFHLSEHFLLFLGTLEPRKNILGIIRAFEELEAGFGITNLQLVLAGPKGWLYHKVRQHLQTSPARERIRVLQYVSEEEKQALYAMADIFLYPSFYEGFGLPILESFSAGTPVITSPVSALPETAQGAALLVDPYNPRALTHAILTLLRDETLKHALVEQGKDIALRYSWEKTAEKTLRIFERVGKNP